MCPILLQACSTTTQVRYVDRVELKVIEVPWKYLHVGEPVKFSNVKLTRDITNDYMACLKGYSTEREIRYDFADWYNKALTQVEGSK